MESSILLNEALTLGQDRSLEVLWQEFQQLYGRPKVT